MNKVAVAAVAVLAAAVLGAPAWVGATIEARVRERVAAIDASDGFAAELTSFDRGWFRSAAKLTLRWENAHVPAVGSLPTPPEDAWLAGRPVPVAVAIAHGPIAVLDGLYLGWATTVARLDKEAPGVPELETTLGVPYVFEFRSRTGFGGDVSFDADAPPFVLPYEEALLTFSGANVEGRLVRRQLETSAEIAAVEVASPTGTFAVHGLRADADIELRSRYVLPGTAAFSVERIVIGGPLSGATPVLEALGLRIASNASLDAAEELLDLRLDYELRSARLPEGELAEAAVGLGLRRLDVAALEAYSAAADDAAAAATHPAQIVRALGPQLERALRAGPSLRLDPLRFRLDDEPFEGHIELNVNTPRLPPVGALNLDNPLLVLGLVNASADVRLSKALAERLATLAARAQLNADGSLPPDELRYLAEAQSSFMLTMLISQGILADDGDGYATTLAYTDGALTVNGSALPFGLP
jgi:uncharacterized protein YdgA (DUF945 family)